MVRVREKMQVVVPLTFLIVIGLLYMNTKSMMKTGNRVAGGAVQRRRRDLVPVALGYNISVAVWVGLIALLGLDAETGIFMLLYLDLSHAERKPKTREELDAAILHLGADAMHRGPG